MTTLSSLLSILLIDVVLSGDNVLVIAMAAHSLPERQRRLAIVTGVGAALVLRVALTLLAAYLLLLPYLHLVGGLLLIWIAFRLLKEDEEAERGPKDGGGLWGAMLTIVFADFMMSLDNVLGVAGASHGDFGLLLIGLAISMTLMAFAGTLMVQLLSRFWWLAYLGCAVIAWVGAEMVFRDPAVLATFPLLEAQPWIELVVVGLVSLLTVLAAHLTLRRPRRSSQTNAA